MGIKSSTVRITLDAGSADKCETLLALVADELAKVDDRTVLRESLEQDSSYHELLKGITTPIVITDLDGRIVDVNEAVTKYLGYSSAELNRLRLSHLVPGADLEEIQKIHTELGTGHGVNIEGQCLSKAGVSFDVSIAVSEIRVLGAVHLCLIILDVTQYKKAVLELEDAQSRIARAERLETSGTVAGQIAHDFNNLLSPLLAYPHLIRRDLPPESQGRQYLDVMEKTVNDMAHMTEQLLALSRRGQFNQRVFSVNDVIKHVMTLLENVFPDTVAVNLQLRDDLMTIKGGHGQLVRVIQNLCHNAIDAMAERGTLTISTDNVYLDEPVGQYGTVEVGEYIRIRVSDNGPGIPDDVKDKIFDPFFTTKKTSKRRGSGLGLSVVHGIIKDHEGYIDLDSTLGSGTTFSIYLPICRDQSAISMDGVARGEHLVIIDDDQTQVELISTIMKKLGYQVDGYNTGEEALEYYKELAERDYPDLLIVDLILKDGMNGVDVLTEVRGLNPSQKTLVISGHSDMKDDEGLRAVGINGFIDKPFTIKKLADSVRSVLDKTVQIEADEVSEDVEPLASAPVPLRKILVVDDEETIRQLFQVILRSELSDVEIDLACNGAEAVEACENTHYDVVIMDLHMPVMDGKAAFLRIQKMSEEQTWDAPSIVFCTGFAPPDSIRTIITENCDHGLLRKPITGSVLVNAVKERLESR